MIIIILAKIIITCLQNFIDYNFTAIFNQWALKKLERRQNIYYSKESWFIKQEHFMKLELLCVRHWILGLDFDIDYSPHANLLTSLPNLKKKVVVRVKI